MAKKSIAEVQKQQNPTNLPKKADQERTRIAKARMIAALKSTLGVISHAAKTAGIDRTVHYGWLDSDPNYKEDVEQIAEERIDFYEAALMKQVKEGNITAIIFGLKTQGKKRGYIETATVINVDANELRGKSDEELMAIIYGQ